MTNLAERNPAIKQLIARWDSPDGHPYKGQLIDWEAYEANPENIGCMCAQGQALHLVGGMPVKDLRSLPQSEADKQTASLLGISRAHAILLRSVNDSIDGAPAIVLTHPEKVLGDQAHIVLAFWRHLDRMTAKQWAAARAAAWVAAGAAAGDAAGAACAEIQGAALMRENGKTFYFLPMFGFADPEAVFAADLELAA